MPVGLFDHDVARQLVAFGVVVLVMPFGKMTPVVAVLLLVFLDRLFVFFNSFLVLLLMLFVIVLIMLGQDHLWCRDIVMPRRAIGGRGRLYGRAEGQHSEGACGEGKGFHARSPLQCRYSNKRTARGFPSLGRDGGNPLAFPCQPLRPRVSKRGSMAEKSLPFPSSFSTNCA